MSDKLYSDIFFILLALVVATLLGFLIGWLMRSVKLNALKKSLDACYKNNEDLKTQIQYDSEEKVFNAHIESSKKVSPVLKTVEVKENKDIKGASTYKATTPTSSNSFNKADAKKVLRKTIKENDLKVVEGIGPKMEEILNLDGITIWKQLGNAPISRLQKILNEAGDRFLLHKPDTCPKQSILAADGQWEELKLQDYLDGGKEPVMIYKNSLN